MTARPPDPDPGKHTRMDTGTPRWVKVFGIVAVTTLVLAFVLMHIVSGGLGGH